MTTLEIFSAGMTSACALALSACDGGSTGTTFIPNPPVTSTPPPASADAFSVKADTQFPTLGDDFKIRWDNSAQTYELQVPAGWADSGGWLRLTKANDGNYYPPSSGFGLSLNRDLTYKYTKAATVFKNDWGYTIGQFAFGVPTPAAEIPTTGSASYDATVLGTATAPYLAAGDYYDVGGTAKLNFDFGAGTLSGSMQPTLTYSGPAVALPTYEFTQTVYSPGGTTFSGSFVVPNAGGNSEFHGQFTGPNAAELMAAWSAPFIDPNRGGTPEVGTMTGLMIGKRP